MRHRMSGKRLGRTTSHRKALRRNQAVALLEHGAIRTTEAKAKELRRFVEKLITAAKEGTLHARRRVIARLGHDRLMFDENNEPLDQTVVQKLFDEIALRYQDRPGGYTRIIQLAERRIGDAGKQVILQLVEEMSSSGGQGESQGESRRRRRAAKRHEAAAEVAVPEGPADTEGPEEPEAPREPEDEVEAPEETAEGPDEPEGEEKEG